MVDFQQMCSVLLEVHPNYKIQFKPIYFLRDINMKETLRQRIGVDVGRRVSGEDTLEWAAPNEVYLFDIQTDIVPNALV